MHRQIIMTQRIRHIAVAAVVAALASMTAACSLDAPSATSGTPELAPSNRQTGVSYRDPEFGWTIRHARRMHTGHFTSNGMFTADGEWVANFDLGATGDETRGGGIPDLRRLRTFPDDGAALMIWFGERLPAPPPLRDSRFPLTMETLHPIARYVGGSEPIPRYRTFDGNGSSFAVAVWFGPHASANDRRSIERTLESLRFPPLRTGTFRARRYYVLSRVQAYPKGSVTHIAASTLPAIQPCCFTRSGFYLVHAPRALYAIPDTFAYPDSKRSCRLTYDPNAQVFSCPSTTLRWNRDGTLVASPDSNAGHAPDWDLGLHVATVAQDGHVLYSPFFGALLGLRLKGSPWV
jgi:hypothetical protein